jgi:hypothetical protein
MSRTSITAADVVKAVVYRRARHLNVWSTLIPPSRWRLSTPHHSGIYEDQKHQVVRIAISVRISGSVDDRQTANSRGRRPIGGRTGQKPQAANHPGSAFEEDGQPDMEPRPAQT